VYTGPGTLGGRFLRSFWQPICVAEDLQPGRAIPIRVMSETFTLYRGVGGRAHTLASRCPHRGTQLSTGRVEGDALRCFYHGWKFSGDGACIEAPAERSGFCDSIHVRTYPTEEYLGLIFAFLGEGEAPPLPRYPELEDEGVLEVSEVVVWPCNYFNRLENSVDPVHVPFVHAESEFTEYGLADVPEVWGEETDFGLSTSAKRPNGAVRVTHFHMPNVNYFKGVPNESGLDWVEHLSWRLPVDDEHCASFVVQLTHVTGVAADEYRERRRRKVEKARTTASATLLGPDVLAGTLRIADIEDRTFIVNLQDYVAQIGQGTIADRSDERLGRSDRVVILMRKLWLRELQALADGRPLKHWHRSSRVLATLGV
jgi:5,5'-dehydrodivanillate O-demethylase oxygenase subunit